MLTIIYDSLVDDDEDIRDSGAKIVSSILSNGSPRLVETGARLSLSPCSASSALLQYLSSNYSKSTTLVLEAVWRLTSLAESIEVAFRTDVMHTTKDMASFDMKAISLRLTPVSVLFERATQQQNVVFEEEKQNLYLDPVMEAETWAQILVDIETEAWPSGLAMALRFWTESGLVCLFHAIDESVEGPLGLTSRADVFALFMQVVLVARVLVLVDSIGPAERQPFKEELDMSMITANLENLYERGQDRDLHPLILGRLRRILGEVGIAFK